MFGTLRPHRCGLGSPEREAYDAFYCGLCKSLGDGFGQASRALVSHDAVFLAMLVDGLSERPAKPDRCRCPLLPVVHRTTAEPSGVAMRFASAVEILLGDQYLADRALEGKRLARLARPFSRRYVARATARLSDLGVDFSALEGFESRQAACEELGRTTPADAARPTAEALALVFATMARLPGIHAEAREAGASEALASLGAALGRIIYLADALDDLKKDFERGDFNPCIGRVRGALVIDDDRIDEAIALLRRALGDARRALAALPLARNRELLESVIEIRLPQAGRDAAHAARRASRAARDEERARIAALGWGRRLLHQVTVFAAFVLAWLFGGPASAQAPDRQRPKPKPSASTEPSASAAVPAPPLPIAPTSSGARPDGTAPSDPDRSPGPERDPQTGKPLGPETDPQDGSEPPCRGCESCWKGCESCCGEVCGKCPCGDACKSCPCCDGCKGGNPCDGCCKSCGDPCKGCCSGCGGGGGGGCCGGGKCC